LRFGSAPHRDGGAPLKKNCVFFEDFMMNLPNFTTGAVVPLLLQAPPDSGR
jgi:hypothetical protein